MRLTPRGTPVALLTASCLAILEVLRTSLTRVLEGHPVSLHLVGHRVVILWATTILASPWCALMARRFPFQKGRTVRTVLAHLAGGLVFVALHMSLQLTVHFVFSGSSPFEPGFRLLHVFAFYVAMEMSVYAAIVLVLLLIEARGEASERALASARLERGIAAARLESLRAQLRPHFLFNALNALAVLARRGDGAAADRAIGDLGELLRASFEANGRQEIPLREEMEFLERYVRLQRIRFPGRLDLEWDVPEEARAALVPTMIVQPLVENAIEHGLATVGGGRVRVIARRSGDSLEVEVVDEGPGFGTGEAPGGLGLANTRERLALLYGTRGSLTPDDGPGGGGRVRLRVPWNAPGPP